jgi:hypothetical protein
MRAPAFAFGSIATLALALAAGCSSSSTVTGSTGTPVPQDQFTTQLGNAVCDDIGPCCTAVGLAYDAAKCRQSLAASIGAQLADPLRSYDPIAGGNCVAVAGAAAKGCFTDATAFIAQCGKVIVGNVAAGGACSSSGQCAVPAGADYASCTAGKCAVKKHGKAGDPCDSSCRKTSSGGTSSSSSSSTTPTADAASCWREDNLSCGADGKCEASGAIGSACVYGSCVATGYCGSDGKCAAKGAAGAACAGFDACLDGNYCATTPPARASR